MRRVMHFLAVEAETSVPKLHGSSVRPVGNVCGVPGPACLTPEQGHLTPGPGNAKPPHVDLLSFATSRLGVNDVRPACRDGPIGVLDASGQAGPPGLHGRS